MINTTRIKKRFALKKIERSMKNAETFGQWRAFAAEHDNASGADIWKLREDSELFDSRQIRARHKYLKECCKRGDAEEVLFTLNEGIHGNMGGMGNSALYKRSKLGTKKLIDDYVKTQKEALHFVADVPESEIPFEEKLDFFRRASNCFGRSALTLSGGSGLIYFHHGVVDTLLQEGLLPNVISGASAGAWMCAQIGTQTDQELKGYFQNKRYQLNHTPSAIELIKMFSGRGNESTEAYRDDVIEAMVGNQTFQEAYEHTGRYINVSIAPYERHQTSRLMNAIASPNVTIRSAIQASSSVPGMVKPVALEAKDSKGRIKPYLRNRLWVDGSMAEDLPFKRLARMFGVNHYIVSMINPIAVPFLREDHEVKNIDISRSLQKFYFQAVKESIKYAKYLTSPVLRNRADTFFSLLHDLMDQEYAGNINLLLKPSQTRARYALFNFRDDSEIEALINAGRQATWPKINQIKNATSISHVIDDILSELEQASLSEQHPRHKVHITL